MIGSVCFHVGEGSKVCGDVKIQTGKLGANGLNGTEERILGIFSCLSESA